MTRVIYKYPLHAVRNNVDLPTDAIVRLVGSDPASGAPTLWIEHVVGGAQQSRTFIVHGTGAAVEDNLLYTGSVISGMFVWHVFELPRPSK